MDAPRDIGGCFPCLTQKRHCTLLLGHHSTSAIWSKWGPRRKSTGTQDPPVGCGTTERGASLFFGTLVQVACCLMPLVACQVCRPALLPPTFGRTSVLCTYSSGTLPSEIPAPVPATKQPLQCGWATIARCGCGEGWVPGLCYLFCILVGWILSQGAMLMQVA